MVGRISRCPLVTKLCGTMVGDSDGTLPCTCRSGAGADCGADPCWPVLTHADPRSPVLTYAALTYAGPVVTHADPVLTHAGPVLTLCRLRADLCWPCGDPVLQGTWTFSLILVQWRCSRTEPSTLPRACRTRVSHLKLDVGSCPLCFVWW